MAPFCQGNGWQKRHNGQGSNSELNTASSVKSAEGADNASVTFVIPVKDEQATLVPLYHAIADEATRITKIWEVIFIDDGSSDGSWTEIKRLAGDDVSPGFQRS